MIEIVVATRNQGKLAEIRAALADLDIKVVCLDDFPDAPEIPEDGETFRENAWKKASAIAGHTGKFALADDSGLVVDALGGAPGVYSARYAGEDAGDESNNEKLLEELKKLPEAPRTARFVCVIVVATPQGGSLTTEGSCEGEILERPRGQHGFGYDPLFFHPPLNATFSEIDTTQKLEVSHRGKALRELKQKINILKNPDHPDYPC